MTARDIERAVVYGLYNTRRWLVVPNVSWGLGLHECDLLAVSASSYAHEIEIKISKGDLVRDAHRHRIACLWFAMPEGMRDCIDRVPQEAGVILVDMNTGGMHVATRVRPAHRDPLAKPWSPEQRAKLARLGLLRYWSMRHRGLDDRAEIADLPEVHVDGLPKVTEG